MSDPLVRVSFQLSAEDIQRLPEMLDVSDWNEEQDARIIVTILTALGPTGSMTEFEQRPEQACGPPYAQDEGAFLRGLAAPLKEAGYRVVKLREVFRGRADDVEYRIEEEL